MCFNPTISISFAIMGLMFSAISFQNKKLRNQGIPYLMLFYTLMEILQAIQYRTVNDCKNPENRFLLEVAYFLVIVQPTMWNIFGYHNASDQYRKIFVLSILMTLVWIIFNVSSRIIKKKDSLSDVMSNKQACTYKNKGSHLYWQWNFADFGGLNANWLMYLTIWFVPLLMYPKTRLIGILIICSYCIGTLFALRTNNMSELASMWCFISVPMMISIMLASK